MGQKSNINTIRKTQYVQLSNSLVKINFLEIIFIKYLQNLLNNKGIQCSQIKIGSTNNKTYFSIYTFYNSRKLIFYKKKLLFKEKKQNLSCFLKKILRFTKNNILEIKIININRNINKGLTQNFFEIYKKYITGIFDKRFFLCLDISKITALFAQNKLSSWVFLNNLGSIFSMLHKKNHLKFFKLLNDIFYCIINPTQTILGLKLCICGKLSGNMMASEQTIIVGSVPNQSLSKNIDFQIITVYTVYGTFGFKLWTNKIIF